MNDPLEILRLPVVPVEPDSAFATRLRERVERALDLPRGVNVSSETSPSSTATDDQTYRQGDIGYAWVSVPDVERAVTFYGAVFGWTVEPGSVDQGRQVQERSPHLGLLGGQEHPTLNCCYAVADVDAAAERVRAAGGQASAPSTRPYGRVSDCVDDAGTDFALYQPPDGVGDTASDRGRHGDLAYTTFEVVDSARMRAFYGAVLGWEFSRGGVEDGWQIQGGAGGLQGGHERVTTLPMWRVEDMTSALAAVRDAGGSTGQPQTRPYGIEALCADDQGTRFYLGQL